MSRSERKRCLNDAVANNDTDARHLVACNVRTDHPTNFTLSNVCAWTGGRDGGFPKLFPDTSYRCDDASHREHWVTAIGALEF